MQGGSLLARMKKGAAKRKIKKYDFGLWKETSMLRKPTHAREVQLKGSDMSSNV